MVLQNDANVLDYKHLVNAVNEFANFRGSVSGRISTFTKELWRIVTKHGVHKWKPMDYGDKSKNTCASCTQRAMETL